MIVHAKFNVMHTAAKAITILAWLFLISVVFCLRAAERTRFNERQFLDFMESAARFERELLGCPDDARYTTDCSPEHGTFDAKRWNEVVKKERGAF